MAKKPRMTRVTWKGSLELLGCKTVHPEPWSHLISRLSMIVQVIVVLNRTVVVDID